MSTTHFRSTVFHGEVWFFKAKFDLVNFVGAQFLDRAIFTNARFEHPNFRDTHFHDEAYFGRAKFRGEANFSHVKFSPSTSFEHCASKASKRYTPEGNWPTPGFLFDDVEISAVPDQPTLVLPDGWRIEATPAGRLFVVPDGGDAEPE